MEYKDYYTILGVDRKANLDQIKHAYRKLARKYHPDVSKESNAEENFKNVKEAYEVLKDPQKRSAYDQLGSNWKSGQEFRPPPNWDSYTRFYTGGANGGFEEADMSGFSDFFTNLFGGAHAHRTRFDREDFSGFQQRGSDQHAKIAISLEEAFKGITKTLQMQIPQVDPATRTIFHKQRTIKVNIPPGALKGQQLRLAGQGQAGINGGPNGDLYLEIEIEPHSLFSLQGHDVYLTLPVTPWEAALGCEIKIPTLGGPVGLKLAAGSQAGQKLRLKGRGMPAKSGSGDQYAILQILTPSPKNEEDKQLYQKMAETMPFNPRSHWST